MADYVPTIRRVRPGGAGTKDGLTWENAFGEVEMQADLTPGRLYTMAGVFTPSAGIVTSGTPGTAVNPIGFESWKADLSGPTYDFIDMASISGAGHSASVWVPGNYQWFSGFDVKNGAGRGFDNIACRHSSWSGCKIQNHTTRGMYISYQNIVSRCIITGNGEIGLYMAGSAIITDSHIYNNGASNDNLFISGGIGVAVTRCYLSGGSKAMRITNPAGANISFCTVDGAVTGLDVSGSVGPILILGNQITNCNFGINSIALNRLEFNNFFGNVSDQTALTKIFARTGNLAVDPQYVDIPNHNYEIQNAALTDIEMPPMLGKQTIGAFQGRGPVASRGKTLKTGGML
jgi:hypothetical protein